jgi:hypothetical protein
MPKLALRPRLPLCALCLALSRLAPTAAAAPSPVAEVAGVGEAGLWRVVNRLDKEVHTLQGEVQRLASEREGLLQRLHAAEEAYTQHDEQLAALRRTVEGTYKGQDNEGGQGYEGGKHGTVHRQNHTVRDHTALHSLQGEMVRLKEVQRAADVRHTAALGAAEARHTAAVATLEQQVSNFVKGNKQQMSRSRKQASQPCGAARSQSVMDACCPTAAGHRRLQTHCALPSTCGTLHCADAFTSFYEDCTQMVDSTPAYQSLYSNCQELKAQSAQMLLQPVTVQMFKVRIVTNVTAIPSAPPSPPTPAVSASGLASAGVQEYHAVCTATIIGCVPACNATTHGYELLATIDGTDTKLSCNLAHNNIYSWLGHAADGGYIGTDLRSWQSAVLSGAAGLYHVLASVAAAGVGVDLTIHPGMKVYIMGYPTVWGVGDFTVQQGGSLSLARITLAQTAHIAVSAGGSLTLADLALRTTQLTFASGRGGGLSLANVSFAGSGPPVRGDPCAAGGATIAGGVGAAAAGEIDFWFEGSGYPVPASCGWAISGCPAAEITFTAFETITHCAGSCAQVDVGGATLSGEDIVGTASATQIVAAPAGGWTVALNFTSNPGYIVDDKRGFRARYRCAVSAAALRAPFPVPAADFRAAAVTQSYAVAEDGRSLGGASPAGALDWRCFEPYELRPAEPWRATANYVPWPGPWHCDGATKYDYDDLLTAPRLGGRWVRLAGPAGDALPTAPPGGDHCGTRWAGWLSGWGGGGAAAAAAGAPPLSYATPGALPTPHDGVVPATACFDYGGPGSTCADHAPIAVLHCGAFLLWRLPDATECPLAYCAAPSELPCVLSCSTHHSECFYDAPGVYHCECHPGYSSDSGVRQCSMADYPCTAPSTDAGGDLNDPNGGGACLEINECASLPCQQVWTVGLANGMVTNANSCNDFVDYYTCTCQAGYAGFNCDVDLDECGSNPCQNGATCTDNSFAYQCTCANGFSGYNCATDVNECSSSPCQNGATCSDSTSSGSVVSHSYTCTCVAGYESTPGNEDCAIDIDECASSPCVNGATCAESISNSSIPNNHYRCTCAAGFADGVCGYTDFISEYAAECAVSTSLFRPAFSGNCDIDVDECASAPCANGATCHDSVDDASIPVHTYQCVCLSGFANGACGYTDYINEYTAQCTVPNSAAGSFSGNCDIDVDECASVPCANGATCHDSVDDASIPVHTYQCTCANGFSGYNCDRV